MVVRRLWECLPEEGSRHAVVVAEQFADGEATAAQLTAAGTAAWAIVLDWGERYDTLDNACITEAVRHAEHCTSEKAEDAARYCLAEARNEDECHLLRDVFGNPFRPVSIDPAWLTPTVLALAHAACVERQLPAGHLDPARLGVLADALEDAGCGERTILDHLRGPRPHVRGCWAVDHLLGKK